MRMHINVLFKRSNIEFIVFFTLWHYFKYFKNIISYIRYKNIICFNLTKNVLIFNTHTHTYIYTYLLKFAMINLKIVQKKEKEEKIKYVKIPFYN